MTLNNLIADLKKQIIDTLHLEDITPEEIEATEPLFGEGLGLDSIDALELVVMLRKQYGISIDDMEIGMQAFASVNSLAIFITEQQENATLHAAS